MRFDYDPAKRDANLAKHGFDFADASALWADLDALVVPAKSASETRRALIGRHQGKHWTASTPSAATPYASSAFVAAETTRGTDMSNKTTAANLETRFDAGEDVSDYFDFDNAVRVNHRKERVNLDLPVWMIRRLDLTASRNGLARQAQIKAWLVERLKAESV